MIDKIKIKNIGCIVLVISTFEILRYSIPYYFPFEKLNNEHKLSVFQLLFTIIAGSWALRLYYIANIKDKDNYLKNYVLVLKDDDCITIKTEVKNETNIDREIYASFLVITKQGSKIVEEVNNNLNQSFNYTNNFSNLKFSKNVINEEFAFIQLPYYYSENVKVGNEDLSYSIGLHANTNTSDSLQIYEVRFFVFRNPKDTNPYHRSVQTTFSLNSKLDLLFKDFNKKS